MHLVLSKHHGLGNDFLVCDVSGADPGAEWPEVARHLCHRRTGVGADGLLLLGIEGPRLLTMRLFNADGSEAEMSGNGIRCLVQAAHRALAGSVGATYEVDTAAGRRTAEVLGEIDATSLEIRVDMGPVTEIPEPAGWGALECDPMRPVRHLSLGNPHSVVGVEDVGVVDLARLGALVPDINLEIVEPGPGTDAVTMRVHERGVGITSACGTGACAAAAAALAWGVVPASVPEVTVHMDGGDARVRIADGRASLTGPATWVGTVSVAM